MAVAAELKKRHGEVRVVYIGQRGDKFARIVAENKHIDSTKLIFAGKFRRYHGESWRQLLDIKTVLLNLRDVFLIVLGCMQSWWIMKRLSPNVVFVKGGFVGVPVGLAAAFWRIPYITHDSDALAGLANRIIAKWARIHAVALPENVYNYPPDKTVTVGVPIAPEYRFVDTLTQENYKKQLELSTDDQLLFVTGGGLGAKVINNALIDIAGALLKQYPKLHIIHTAGHAHKAVIADEYARKVPQADMGRVVVKDYVTNMYIYSGAADVVIARAGATNMAELAVQGKACVVVPNPVLAGGHQLKNAKAFAEADAVILVSQAAIEKDHTALQSPVDELLGSVKKRETLGKKLHAFAYVDAAQKLAMLLLKEAKK